MNVWTTYIFIPMKAILEEIIKRSVCPTRVIPINI